MVVVMMMMIHLIIYLRADLTAQWSITKQARVKKRK
jgi:hypothetical protein